MIGIVLPKYLGNGIGNPNKLIAASPAAFPAVIVG